MLSVLDALVTQWVNGPAGFHPVLDNLMIAVTRITIPAMVLAVAVRWWARHERQSERRLAVEVGTAFVAGLLLNQLILLFVNRIRPYDAGVSHLIIAPSGDPSFPSDHATGAAAIVAGMWLHGYARRAMLFAIPAALLVVSRVYVGTHYVSDVLGGSLTGILAAAAVQTTARLRAPLTAALVRLL